MPNKITQQIEAFKTHIQESQLFPNQLFSEIQQAKTSAELKEILFRASAMPGMRVVDIFLLRGGAELLASLSERMTPDDWYDVLMQKNTAGLNVVGVWLKNQCKPLQALDMLMSNLPSNQARIDVMIQKFTYIDWYEQTQQPNLITNHAIPFTKRLQLLKGLSDKEKEQVLLAAAENSNGEISNLLIQAMERRKLSKILSKMKDKTVKANLKDYIEKHRQRRIATHYLGIKDSEPTVSLYGMNEVDSFKDFKAKLNSYQPSEHFKDEFAVIQKAFSQSEAIFTTKMLLGSPEDRYLKSYLAGNLTIIPSGWIGHSMTIAVMGSYLVVANRGEQAHKQGGCIIYKLSKKMSKEDISYLMYSATKMSLRGTILQIVEKDAKGEPLVVKAIPVKPQKYGTCSIANKKAAVFGILVLLKWLKSHDNNATIDDEIFNEYKKFTSHTRTLVLSEMLTELKATQLNKEELLDSLASFCNQHLDLKKTSEVKLLRQILKEIPADLWQTFSQKLSSDAKMVIEQLQTVPQDSKRRLLQFTTPTSTSVSTQSSTSRPQDSQERVVSRKPPSNR